MKKEYLEEQRRLSQVVDSYRIAAHETRLKHTNVLLVACAASIGFAITQTTHQVLTIWILFWALAVLAWSLSFVMGCGYMLNQAASFYADIDIAKAESYLLGHPKRDELLEDLHSENSEAAFIAKTATKTLAWQFSFFIFGMVFYIIWHLIEMWRRIPENMCLWV